MELARPLNAWRNLRRFPSRVDSESANQPFSLPVVKLGRLAVYEKIYCRGENEITFIEVFCCNVCCCANSSGAYSANGMPGFEQRKVDQIKRIDIRIQQLEDEKACIARATNREALKTCRQQARPAQKSGSL
jgi:hypothetical protein